MLKMLRDAVMAPARDQFQYSEVPLGVFLPNFDLEFSRKTPKRGSSGVLDDKTSDPALLVRARMPSSLTYADLRVVRCA